MKKRLPDFLIVPSIITRDKGLTPLDGLVYGVIYWYSKLKNERCLLSNRSIAQLLNARSGSVANSISRLSKKEMIKVKLDKYNHREEIIPLIIFKRKRGSLKNEGRVHQSLKNEGGLNPSVKRIRISKNNKKDKNPFKEKGETNKKGLKTIEKKLKKLGLK